MKVLTTIGRLLTLIGIAMVVAKYLFGVEEIASWSLVVLIPGVFLTWFGQRKGKVGQIG